MHIDAALAIESKVPEDDMDFYLECMGGLPMSERETPQELRDGCILIHHVYNKIRKIT
jgi:hypothetical protein